MSSGPNGSERRSAWNEKAGAGRQPAPAIWNSCSNADQILELGFSLEVRERLLQDGARARLPRRAVEFRNVGHDQIDRRRGARTADAISRGEVRDEPEIAARAPGVGVGDDVERRQRLVGRHPADALRGDVIEVRGGDRTPARDRRDVGRDDADERRAGWLYRHRIASSRAITSFVSVTRQ